MSFIRSFSDYVPALREDSRPWVAAQIYESPSFAGPWTLIDTIALNPVDADPAAPATRSFTTTKASLQTGWYYVAFVDADGNVDTTNPVSTADLSALISLSDIKEVLNIDPTDTRKDDQYTKLISWASLAICNYTGRAFGDPIVTEERTFLYPEDAGGYLEIDDATDVASVALVVPHSADLVLTTDEWVAQPTRGRNSPVYTYITLPGFRGAAAYSPLMGFTRNLDVYAAEGRLRGLPTTLKVTASWGWPEVPGDVKLATIWTIEDWVEKAEAEGLSAESIESYSRSWGVRSASATAAAALAIPNRARDLLANYAALSV